MDIPYMINFSLHVVFFQRYLSKHHNIKRCVNKIRSLSSRVYSLFHEKGEMSKLAFFKFPLPFTICLLTV